MSNRRNLNKRQVIVKNHKNNVKDPVPEPGFHHYKSVDLNKSRSVKVDEGNPNKALADILGDLEEEEEILRKSEEKNRYEIQILRQIKKTKDEKIEKMNAEMLQIKLEKERLEQELAKHHNSHMLLDMVDNVEDGVAVLNEHGMKSDFELQLLRQMKKSRDEKIATMTIEMEAIRAEKEKMAHQLGMVKTQLELKISDMTSQINDRREGKPTTLERTLTKSNTGRERTFLWIVDKVKEKRNEGELIVSEYFYPRGDPYKLRLSLGCYGRNLEIRLLVYSGTADDELKWPFKAGVTVMIANRLQPGTFRSQDTYREMARPAEKFFKSSERFVFDFEDLQNSGLMQGDLFVVECFVTIIK